MDLQWINSLVLPMLLLLGTLAAFLMIVMLLIDTVSFYRRRLKRNLPEVASLSSAPDSGDSRKTTPQAVAGEGGEGAERGREVLNVDQAQVGKRYRSRILDQFMIFRSGKSKKELVKLAPPSAPILPESPADSSKDLAPVQVPVATDAALDDATENSQPSAPMKTSVIAPKSAQLPPDTKAPSEPTQKAPPPNGSTSAFGSKAQDQSGNEADEKPPEGGSEEEAAAEVDPKIKLKPLASLEEARKIIEAKAAAVATEGKSQFVGETDDVASLLGIAAPNQEKVRTADLSSTHSKIGPETSDNKAPVISTVAQAPSGTGNHEGENNSGTQEVATRKLKGDNVDDVTAAEILVMNSGEDEIFVLSKQLSELKSSLVQLEKKLKSLKEM